MTWSLMTSPPSSYIIPPSLPLLQPHWGLFSFINTFCMCCFCYLEWPSSHFLKHIYLSALSSSTSSVIPTFNLLVSYSFLYSAYLSSWWDIYLYCYLVNTCLAQAPWGQCHLPSFIPISSRLSSPAHSRVSQSTESIESMLVSNTVL